MKKITSKFASKCSSSNLPIKKGEEIFYDYQTKKAYKVGHQPDSFLNHDALHVQAQEDAFFDNWASQNL